MITNKISKKTYQKKHSGYSDYPVAVEHHTTVIK